MKDFPKNQMNSDVFAGLDKRKTFKTLIWFEYGNMP